MQQPRATGQDDEKGTRLQIVSLWSSELKASLRVDFDPAGGRDWRGNRFAHGGLALDRVVSSRKALKERVPLTCRADSGVDRIISDPELINRNGKMEERRDSPQSNIPPGMPSNPRSTIAALLAIWGAPSTFITCALCGPIARSPVIVGFMFWSSPPPSGWTIGDGEPIRGTEGPVLVNCDPA